MDLKTKDASNSKPSSNTLVENIDEQILAQQEAIEKEVAEVQPLIGELNDISTLAQEYLIEDTIYQKKIKDLRTKYKSIRRTRGDGNCFFRAFAFSYFEKLIGKEKEIENFKSIVRSLADDLVKLPGYCSFTVEDFRDVFIENLDKLKNNMHVDELVKVFCDSAISDYIVVFLRLIVSCYLQRNAEFLECFIEGYSTMKDFCAHEVEPMYRESDHIHIIAITKATNIPIRVVYMDRGDQDKVTEHNFPDDCEPIIHILYRPGHYDILYH